MATGELCAVTQEKVDVGFAHCTPNYGGASRGDAEKYRAIHTGAVLEQFTHFIDGLEHATGRNVGLPMSDRLLPAPGARLVVSILDAYAEIKGSSAHQWRKRDKLSHHNL
mmetsp:Transcript_32562/g.85249  ORF Transcript_32562/g.85249 Transcript_32562/m.85249 type:complete len:110 (-) Transcript_32562:426-755(-)